MSYDPYDSKANSETAEEEALRLETELAEETADLKWLMSTTQGRRIVWRQLDRAGVFRLSFNTNAMRMAFAEGGRNQGIRTVELIHNCCPEFYQPMIDEAKE